MSTLVQQNNPPYYPQSNTMSTGEGITRQQRPTHNPPKNLHSNELHCLYNILGQNCVVKSNNEKVLRKKFLLLDFSHSCCTSFTRS